MDNEQLKRLVELLGKGWVYDSVCDELIYDTPFHYDTYPNPVANADLMVRLMDMLPEFALEKHCGLYRMDSQRLGAWVTGWYTTPQLAVLHATLAKLEAATDEV